MDPSPQWQPTTVVVAATTYDAAEVARDLDARVFLTTFDQFAAEVATDRLERVYAEHRPGRTEVAALLDHLRDTGTAPALAGWRRSDRGAVLELVRPGAPEATDARDALAGIEEELARPAAAPATGPENESEGGREGGASAPVIPPAAPARAGQDPDRAAPGQPTPGLLDGLTRGLPLKHAVVLAGSLVVLATLVALLAAGPLAALVLLAVVATVSQLSGLAYVVRALRRQQRQLEAQARLLRRAARRKPAGAATDDRLRALVRAGREQRVALRRLDDLVLALAAAQADAAAARPPNCRSAGSDLSARLE